MEYIKRPNILEANWIFLVLALALIFVGGILQSKEIYTGILITEYMLILVPNILYLNFKGYSLRKVLRLNSIRFKEVIYILFIIIFSYPMAVFLNLIFINIIHIFSDTIPNSAPMPSDLNSFIKSFFVIAITPGICEEIMFRGTILNSYEVKGKFKAILISSLLFGLFHFNIFNFAGPTFLGIILGVLVLRTDSILASIVGHTFNNTIALSIGYLITNFVDDTQMMDVDIPVYQENIQIVIFILMGVFAIVSFLLAIKLINHMPRIAEYNEVSYFERRGNVLRYFPIFVAIFLFIIYNYVLLV